MGELENLQETWDRFADADPLWAVLTDPSRGERRWTVPDFLAAGEREIAAVLERLAVVGIPLRRERALDFGCGAGRLTSALGARFDRVCGVDISQNMLRVARETTAHRANCAFRLNATADLGQFPSGEFDFVYSSIVLQHMPSALALGYVAEFRRVLRDDGIGVFQIPDRHQKSLAAIPLLLVDRVRSGLAGRRRLDRSRPRPRGESHPEALPVLEMHGTPEDAVRRTVEAAGCSIVDRVLTNSTDSAFNGNLRYTHRAPRAGWVSKQYTIVRRMAA